jgi:hypothetical protein
MGILDIFGKRDERNPNELLADNLTELDPILGSSFSSYLLNRSRLTMLQREASEQYQLVKSRGKTEQARAMDVYFRESFQLVEQQTRLLAKMHACAKNRRFRMAGQLGEAHRNLAHTEETLRRIVNATNDPAINRLQGMQDALAMHRGMEVSVLWPTLQ